MLAKTCINALASVHYKLIVRLLLAVSYMYSIPQISITAAYISHDQDQ